MQLCTQETCRNKKIGATNNKPIYYFHTVFKHKLTNGTKNSGKESKIWEFSINNSGKKKKTSHNSFYPDIDICNEKKWKMSQPTFVLVKTLRGKTIECCNKGNI